MATFSLQVVKRGLVTLPKELRDAYGIQEGDSLTLIDLGGVFVLSRKPSEVDEIADRLAQQWSARGETLETMLRELREVREKHAAES
jgi:AbrB family looped-hinge helix DNA binding protein